MSEGQRDRAADIFPPSSTTARTVLIGLIRDPMGYVFRRWNWKSAMLSSAIRGAIFFFSNIGSGLAPAVRAAFVELLFVATTNGLYGALTQAFAMVRPFWTAAISVMILVPALAHSLEFLFHWAGGTPHLRKSILASLAFSMISALFNLYAMRRGVLIVGRASRSFTDDLRSLPGIALEFLLVLTRPVVQAARTLLDAAFLHRHGKPQAPPDSKPCPRASSSQDARR